MFLSFSLQDEGELGQLMKIDNETREVVREMRQKVDEAKSSLSSNRSRGKVLDALMQQKKSGRIPGIFGRLVIRRYNILIYRVTQQQLIYIYGVHNDLSLIIAINNNSTIIHLFCLTSQCNEKLNSSCVIIYLCSSRETLEP